MNNYEVALDADAKGYTCIPIRPELKIPAVPWKIYQTQRPTPGQYRQWFQGTRNNIALLCTGLVVFDVDDFAKAKLVLEECEPTSHILRTPRGIHDGYRKRKEVEDVSIRGRLAEEVWADAGKSVAGVPGVEFILRAPVE